MYFTIEVNLWNSLFAKFFSLALPARDLNKDPIVKLDGARPANTCITTPFLRNIYTKPPAICIEVFANTNPFLPNVTMKILYDNEYSSIINIYFYATFSSQTSKHWCSKNISRHPVRHFRKSVYTSL
jgi:hypothetical protein